ncbi:MAG: P-loop NTPase [Alphaproteobacteria bacterium]|nr:P-loop NTPase [Alphaproteobacteria bacterium]
MIEKQLRSDKFLAFVNDKETLDLVNSLSMARYGLKTEAQQANIKSAITYLQHNSSPKLLLVDITGSEFPITDMKALADVCEPGVIVIAIGERNDVGVFRDLVKLGVKDYIAKPLNSTLLMQSIETQVLGTAAVLANQEGFNYAGKLISFIGAKGGVGSSTLAANCSWALAHAHYKRICLMDLDFHHGSIGQFFNVEINTGLRELLAEPERIDESVMTRAATRVSDYLSLLSAPLSLDDHFDFPKDELASFLSIPLNQCHYTVLDFPRYNHKDHFKLMAMSNVIVICCDLTLLSVRESVNLARLLRTSQEVQILIVANKVGEHKKGELSPQIFQESISHEIDLIINFDGMMALPSLNEGVPVASEKGSLSEGIYKLASLITGKQAKVSNQNNSFFGNLFGSGKTVA